MKILDRYLAGAVITGTGVTLAVLLPLLGFFLLADEMDEVGEANYTFGAAVLFVTLSLPRYAYQVFPIATLIGALVGLGTLASRSELVAMRAAGVSISRIVAAALKAGLLLALIAFALGEGLAPIAEQRALEGRAAAKADQVTLKTPYGFWARDGSSYVNIREIQPGGTLRGIEIYEVSEDQRLALAIRAGEARYVGGRWVLRDIARSQVSPDGVEVTRVALAGWDSVLDPGLLDVVVVEPHVLPVWTLMRYVRFMTESAQDAGRYEVVLWGKVVHPFLIVAMIFLAIPILFGSARSSGTGLRILAGVMVGIGFYLVSRTFTYLSLLYDLSPMLAAMTPPLLFMLGAAWVLRRVG